MDDHAVPAAPARDDKDWTWVLGQRCGECGFDAAAISFTDIPAIVLDASSRLGVALEGAGASVRREASTWSVTEYGCHVRDVCRRFGERLRLMRSEDDPQFDNWDQDATALQDRYWEQDPAVVAGELHAAATAIAGDFASVAPGEYARPGRRSNGSVFTVDTLGRYFAHDLVHHVHDVGA